MGPTPFLTRRRSLWSSHSKPSSAKQQADSRFRLLSKHRSLGRQRQLGQAVVQIFSLFQSSIPPHKTKKPLKAVFLFYVPRPRFELGTYRSSKILDYIIILFVLIVANQDGGCFAYVIFMTGYSLKGQSLHLSLPSFDQQKSLTNKTREGLGSGLSAQILLNKTQAGFPRILPLCQSISQQKGPKIQADALPTELSRHLLR